MSLLESFVEDIRFGLRTLVKNRGFTAVAVLTLAIGIGANTAMFTVLNAVVLQPVRFPAPERLMVLLSSNETGTKAFLSAPGVYTNWRERSTSFETIEGAAGTVMILSGSGQPHPVNISRVSAGFFDVIGVAPILGRRFDTEEDQPGRAVSVLLDAGFWKSEFGGRSDVLGRRITLDDKPYDVIGILPEGTGFAYLNRADIWMPLEANRNFRTGGNVIAVGHLKHGITRKAAQAEMEAVMSGIGREHMEDSKTGVQVKPMRDWITAEVRRMFQMVSGAAAFVFLICCANVANLVLARSTARRRELAIRASLGAGKLRLVRQLAAENLILAVAGGCAGAGVAMVLIRAVPAIKAFYIPRADEIVVDWRLFAIAVLTTFIAGLLCGIVPAWQTARRDLARSVHSTASAAGGRERTRDVLVAGQFALALMLLTGAGMLVKSLWSLLTIDTGFERDRVVSVRTFLPYKKYDEVRRRDFYERLMSEVERMPGVRMAAMADRTPLEAVLFPYDLAPEGGGRKVVALARHVGPAYFDVLGIMLLAGRTLEAADANRSPIPVVVNRQLAYGLFGEANPIGRMIRSPIQRLKNFQIIGIAGDTRQIRLADAPGPQIYLPVARGYPNCIIIKAAPNAGDLTAAVRSVVLKLDPEVPAPEVSTLQANFDREIAKPRFYSNVLGSFALIGVLLAAIGIYGVTSYAVTRRTHEFGIRMAIGARPADILRLVLAGGARLTIAGAITGLAGAVAVTRLLASTLYGAKPNDPVIIASVLILLIAVGLLACFVAARRVTRVDPAVALRCD